MCVLAKQNGIRKNVLSLTRMIAALHTLSRLAFFFFFFRFCVTTREEQHKCVRERSENDARQGFGMGGFVER